MAIATKLARETEEDDDRYPSGDGKPMAEMQLHVDAILQLRGFLDDLLAGRADVWIGTDQFWYWRKGRPGARTAPDIMVVFGVSKEPPRRSFFTWRENGAIPAFICEFASQHTWRGDLGPKFRRFERLGAWSISYSIRSTAT